MKRFYVLFLVLAASFGNLQAMQSQEITLIAADNTPFIVPKHVAFQAETIKEYFEDMNNPELNSVNFANISKETLGLVAIAMQAMSPHMNLKGKALLDAIAQDLLPKLPRDFRTHINLLHAADYLGLKPLYQTMIREIAARIPLDDPAIVSELKKEFEGFPDAQKELARWKYLLTGTPASAEIQQTFNVSLRELLDYGTLNRKVVTKEVHGGPAMTILDLSNLQLTDLDGLQEIPDITKCTSLLLMKNKLTVLPVGIFAGLIHLRRLLLGGNHLNTLPVGIFAGLTQLGILTLDHNQLSTLPVGVFTGLAQLNSLYLDNNQLSTLPVGIFAGLIQLEVLHLDRNQLSTLPERIFAGLTRLGHLYLGGNHLSEEMIQEIKSVLPGVRIDLINSSRPIIGNP